MRTALLLAGLLSIAPAIAQDPSDQQPGPSPTAAERMQELQDQQKSIVAEWRAAIAAAREGGSAEAKPGEVVKAMPMRPDFGPLAAKAMQFAREFSGTDDAVPFLLFVVQNGGTDKAAVRGAFETLLAKHVDSPALAQMGPGTSYIGRMVDPEFAAVALDRLIASTDPKVRGWALLAKHQRDIEKAPRDSEAYRDARGALITAAEAAGDERLAAEIRGVIDLREKLGVGNVAPDIAGVDLDGVAFKLSDYQGKVVFLDFWGDW